MDPNNTASITLNLSLPKEIIKEYFDGMAKVEAAKKHSTDLSSLAFLIPIVTPLLASYLTPSKSTEKKVENNKKEDSSVCGVSVSLNCSSDDKNCTGTINKVKDATKTISGLSDLLTSFTSAIGEGSTDNDREQLQERILETMKKIVVEKEESKSESKEKDEVESKAEVKEESTKDCYEELYEMVHEEKCADLLRRIKKDGNMLKAFGIINGVNAESVQPENNKIEIKEESKAEIKEESKAEIKTEGEVKKPIRPVYQENDMMASFSKVQNAFSGGDTQEGIKEAKKAMDNMMGPNNDIMKNFGPLLEGLMGGFGQMAKPAEAKTTDPTSTSDVKLPEDPISEDVKVDQTKKNLKDETIDEEVNSVD